MHFFYRQEVKKLISSCLRIYPIRNPISHSEFEKRISIMDKMLWNKVRGNNREGINTKINPSKYTLNKPTMIMVKRLLLIFQTIALANIALVLSPNLQKKNFCFLSFVAILVLLF